MITSSYTEEDCVICFKSHTYHEIFYGLQFLDDEIRLICWFGTNKRTSSFSLRNINLYN